MSNKNLIIEHFKIPKLPETTEQDAFLYNKIIIKIPKKAGRCALKEKETSTIL